MNKDTIAAPYDLMTEAIVHSLGAGHVPARLAAAHAAPDDAHCGRCGRQKQDHRNLQCPPITTAERLQAMVATGALRAPGGIFEPRAEEAD